MTSIVDAATKLQLNGIRYVLPVQNVPIYARKVNPIFLEHESLPKTSTRSWPYFSSSVLVVLLNVSCDELIVGIVVVSLSSLTGMIFIA